MFVNILYGGNFLGWTTHGKNWLKLYNILHGLLDSNPKAVLNWYLYIYSWVNPDQIGMWWFSCHPGCNSETRYLLVLYWLFLTRCPFVAFPQFPFFLLEWILTYIGATWTRLHESISLKKNIRFYSECFHWRDSYFEWL